MSSNPQPESAIASLGATFWEWRAHQQPRTSDDIPRLVRPLGWLPCWSLRDAERYRVELSDFEAGFAAVPEPSRGGERVARAALVDHAILGSAIARVRFELDVLRNHRTHPGFYVDQSLGVYFDELLARPASDGFGVERSERVAVVLGAIPGVLAQGLDALAGGLVREYAAGTVADLADVEGALGASVAALLPFLVAEARDRVQVLAADAGAALGAFREALTARLPDAAPWAPVGEQAVAEFLRTVALNPMTADTITEIGTLELARAEALSAIEHAAVVAQHGSIGAALSPMLPDVDAQVERERLDELAIREFLDGRGLLSQPADLGHYLVAPMPGYLAPIRWLGVTDDLTGDDRVDEDGVSYMPDPSPDLPYFYEANARDPRAGIIHEGAHYQQLALSWRNPVALRRRYVDSGPNEGIAFYNEELMLRSGLFADAPGTRLAVHSFLRLRALRVLVDVGLATGRLGISEAAQLMADRVPMDLGTAAPEAAFFAATPMQGGTYQIGKAQIEAFLADAVRVQGDAFDLRAFHDFLWTNGNVPIALLRYELLGLDDELDRIRL